MQGMIAAIVTVGQRANRSPDMIEGRRRANSESANPPVQVSGRSHDGVRALTVLTTELDVTSRNSADSR